jgi:hypothetical protein
MQQQQLLLLLQRENVVCKGVPYTPPRDKQPYVSLLANNSTVQR